MKIFFRHFAFLLLILCCGLGVRASHCAGGEIIYKHLPGTPDSTYHVTFKLYRDCVSGTMAPNDVPLCILNTCTNTTIPGVTLQAITYLPGGSLNGAQVLLGCSGSPTNCQSPGSSLPGYQEYWYEGDITLPSRCSQWEFSVSINARNANQNLAGGTGNVFFIKATLNNQLAQANSSPSFTVKPVPFVCINKPYTFNNGAIDDDGDSLSYQLLVPLTGGCGTAGTSLTFSNGIYNIVNNPIASNNTFVLNPSSGQMSFTPTVSGKFTLTLRVREYRNHVNIGSVIRDIQVIVLPNCNSVQPLINVDSQSISGQLINGTIHVCANTPLNFCFHVGSTLSSAVLIVRDNHLNVAPAATMTYLGQYTNNIQGCFSWVPTALDTGYKNFSFTLTDSTCLPPGLLYVQTFSVPVYINSVTTIFRDTGICQGDSVSLRATGGSSFTWTVLPGGSPLSSLSCTNCSNPVASPMVTTRYVVTSTLISACNKNTDTVTITVTPQIQLPQASSNSPVCSGNPLLLYAGINAGSYLWTGPNGFQSSTANPVILAAQVADSGMFQLIVKSGYCTSSPVYVPVTVRPVPPTPLISGKNVICEGDSLMLYATGAGTVYDWTGPNGFASSLKDIIITPASLQQSGIYTVRTYYGGNNFCPSILAGDTVTVSPLITPAFSLSRATICAGDTVTITDSSTSVSSILLHWNFGNGIVESGSGGGPYHIRYPAEGWENITLVTSNAGCRDSVTKKLVVLPLPLSLFHLNPDACMGDTIRVVASDRVGDDIQFNWNFNGASVLAGSGRGVYKLLYPTPGHKVITLSTSGDLCTSLVTADTLFVHPVPDARITDVSRTDICTGDSVALTAAYHSDYSYQWTPTGYFTNNKSSVADAVVTKTGYIYLTAADAYGCAATDSIFIQTAPCCEVYLPNAFTPNGDGRNDLFRVITTGHHGISDFRVLNRWGQTVFESADESHGWDGTHNGVALDASIYFYYLKYKCSNDKFYEQKGDLLLVR